ncbi:hypothetical protein B9Q04_06730 [Candidatus Marsarchaeota G2 archaeon BE_D]|uniref:EamA domain-containing protein n=1 Tax=Candidatus Marsarchaeota G2 archaeon BE_D TaxID=1978158 RepID=A0A2R6CBH9_9ARCH|nr:MAG: hypothetical protein B9Q04_06730 [Candidatus Marsarchaeota G2 archaeon BE_D]
MLMFIGVIVLTANRRLNRFNISKYMVAALAANLLWVAMWIIIYATVPTSVDGSTLFSWIVGVASACSLVISSLPWVKRGEINYFIRSTRTLTPVLTSSLLNGVGSVAYAVAYRLQPVVTPLIVEMYVPAVIVFGSLFLRERLDTRELVGCTLILGSVFAYFLL